MALSIPTTQISFSKTLSSSSSHNNSIFFSKLSYLSIHTHTHAPTKTTTTIRMGGGPRTYPGGVSKWQWKRMQAKKAKQLLKARLCRERQIYEMRKRAELKAAVSELERPWEVVERAPNLFSIKADDQLKALADRFQKPGGFDLWSENDGPQLFQSPDGLPSARFFPKGVVHSVKPYGLIKKGDSGDVGFDDDTEFKNKDGVFSDVDDLLEVEDGLYSDTDNSDGKLGINKSNNTRRNGGEMWKQRRNRVRSGTGKSLFDRNGKGDGAFIEHGETQTNRNSIDDRTTRTVGRINQSSGLRKSRYYESGDGAMMQHGGTKTARSRNDGRTSRSSSLRNSRYYQFGNGGASIHGDETKSNRSRNDGRINRSSVLRNSRYSESVDGALMQHGEIKINRNRNEGRTSRGGGFRNSGYHESEDDISMQHGKIKTYRSRNDGRRSKSGSFRNSRYSSESEVFDMSLQQDGSYGFKAENRFDSHSLAPMEYESL